MVLTGVQESVKGRKTKTISCKHLASYIELDSQLEICLKDAFCSLPIFLVSLLAHQFFQNDTGLVYPLLPPQTTHTVETKEERQRNLRLHRV
jgi:hypothetical protein